MSLPAPRFLLACCLVAALAGCGRSDREVSVAAPSSSKPSAAANGLPTLPPSPERDAAIDRAAAGSSADDWRTLAGFVGRHYTTDLTRGAVVVLDHTVTVRPAADGRWSATGLVRNEQGTAVAGVVAEAELLDVAGMLIETVTATSPVTAIRPGEPAPFAATASSTPSANVATVRWRARALPSTGGADADPATRTIELSTYWARPHGDPKPLDFYLHRDLPGAPHPFVQFGTAVNRGADLAGPRVALAWIDTDGRIVAVDDVPLRTAEGGEAPSLPAGGGRDFASVIADPITGAAASATAPMLWGYGS